MFLQAVRFAARSTAIVATGLATGLVAEMVVAAEVGASDAGANTVRVDMEPRVRACTLCHGEKGRATAEGYFPRIAGKTAGYLTHQLLNFNEGRRHYASMTYLIEHLSDA